MAVAFVFPGHQCFYKYVCRAEQEKEEDLTQEFLFNFPSSHCHEARLGGTKMYTKVRGQKYIISQNNGNYLSALLDILCNPLEISHISKFKWTTLNTWCNTMMCSSKNLTSYACMLLKVCSHLILCVDN